MSRLGALLAVAALCAAGPAWRAAACEGTGRRFRGQFRRRRRRLGDQPGRRGEGRQLRLQARPRTPCSRPQRDLHRQGCRHLLGDRLAGGRFRRRSAPGSCSGARTTRTTSSSACSTTASTGSRGKQDGKWQTIVENVAIERHQHHARRLQQAARQGERQYRCRSSSTARKLRELRGQPPKAAGASACPATISTRRKSARVVFKNVKVTD